MNRRWKTLAVSMALVCAAAVPAAGHTKPEPRSNAQENPSAEMVKPKKHQATGIVIRLTETSILVARGRGKQKTNWNFVLNEKTKTIGLLTRAAKVIVYYHEENGKRIAERIKVLEAAPLPAGNPKPKDFKPKT